MCCPWRCAQSRREILADSRPAVGEQIRQFSKFQTVRPDKTLSHCSHRGSVYQARSGERILAGSGRKIEPKISGLPAEGKYYQWCPLSFGLACSPYYFAKLVQASVKYLALCIPQLCMLHFMDNFLLSDQPNLITKVTGQTVTILESLGWKITLTQVSIDSFRSSNLSGAYDPIYPSRHMCLHNAGEASQIQKRGSAISSKTCCFCMSDCSYGWSMYCHGVMPAKLSLCVL